MPGVERAASRNRRTLTRSVLVVVLFLALFAGALVWRLALINASFALQKDFLATSRLNGDLLRLDFQSAESPAPRDPAFDRLAAQLAARAEAAGVPDAQRYVTGMRTSHERGAHARFLAVSNALRSALDVRLSGAETKTREGFFGLTAFMLVAGGIVAWLLIEGPRRRLRLLEQIDAEQTIIESIPQMVWTKDENGRNDYCNQRFIDFMNVTMDEFVNNSWVVCHPDDVERGQAVWRASVAAGRAYETELRLAPKGVAAYRWFLVRAVPLRDASGRVVKWYGTTTDIDAQKRALEAMDFLAQSSSQLAGAEDVGTVLDRLSRASLEGLAEMSIFDVEEEDGSFRRLVLGASHVPASVLEATRAFDAPRAGEPHPIARAMAGGETIYVPAVDEDFVRRAVTPEARQDAWRSIRITSMIAVPLVVPGRVIGALTLVRLGPSAPFETPEVTIVEEVARRAAVAIENIRLREREGRAARDMQMFADMGAAISGAVGVRETIDAAIAFLVPARADRASIEPDDAAADASTAAETESTIAVPIVAGSMHGTMRVQMTGGRAFSRHDAAFFAEFARRLAPAIANAELSERDRIVARSFQEAALPASLPLVAGLRFDAMYEAGKTEALVGGDWYDVFALADGRIVVSIGDVAGSGLAAAVTMAGVRQSIRGAAHVRADPGVMLDAAQRVLNDDTGRFVTAFVGVIDPRTASLTYGSAGHPPPLLRLAGGAVEELTGNGVPLGVNGGASATERTIDLPAASLLVLYTDGLIEATRDIIAGERQLRAVLGEEKVYAAELPARILHDRMLANGSRDDVAILTIRRV
jgi:PAS domain S-box-containing protein